MAEIKVLFYLRTLNPWGDSTVSRSLKRLDELGYIDFEATEEG